MPLCQVHADIPMPASVVAGEDVVVFATPQVSGNLTPGPFTSAVNQSQLTPVSEVLASFSQLAD